MLTSKEEQIDITVQHQLLLFELCFDCIIKYSKYFRCTNRVSRFLCIIKATHLNHDSVEQTFICAKRENEIFNNHLLGKRMNKVMCAACLRYEILLRTFCLYYILPNISFINNMFYECVSSVSLHCRFFSHFSRLLCRSV